MRIYAFKKKNPSWFSQQQLVVHNPSSSAASGGHNISKTTFVPPPHTTHTTSRPVAVAPCGPAGRGLCYNPPPRHHQQPVLFQEDSISRNKNEHLFTTVTIGSTDQPSTRDFSRYSSFQNDLNCHHHKRIPHSSTSSTSTSTNATSRGEGPTTSNKKLYNSRGNLSNIGSSQSFFQYSNGVSTQQATAARQLVENDVTESIRYDSIEQMMDFSVLQQESSFRRTTRPSQEHHDLVRRPVRTTLQERGLNYFQSATNHHHTPNRKNNGVAVSSSNECSPLTPRSFVDSPPYFGKRATPKAPELDLLRHDDSKNVKIDFENIFEDEVTSTEGLYEMIDHDEKKDNSQQDKNLNQLDFEPYPFEETMPNLSSSFSQDPSTSGKSSHVILNGGNGTDDTHHYYYNNVNQHADNSHFVSPYNSASQESYYLGKNEFCAKTSTISENGRATSEQLIVSPTTSSGGDGTERSNDVSGIESELTNDEIADFLQPLFVENTEAV